MDVHTLGHKITWTIDQASHILLVVHRQPDADALGSLAAVTEWLEGFGKSYTAFCREVPPAAVIDQQAFLFPREQLLTDPEALSRQRFDAVIVLDCGDLSYAGIADVLPQLPDTLVVINIDHHATNRGFGAINLVDPMAVSTTEILYRLFTAIEVDISPTMATALLAGIIFDTANFTNPNTTHDALEIASALLLAGGRLSTVNGSLLKKKTVATLQLWGTVLSRLQLHPTLGIATTVITDQDLADFEDRGEVTGGIANFLNNLSGVTAVLILQQEVAGKIKGSLRTNSDLIDVAKLATLLGGGGHRKAAGFTVSGTLTQTIEGHWQIV